MCFLYSYKTAALRKSVKQWPSYYQILILFDDNIIKLFLLQIPRLSDQPFLISHLLASFPPICPTVSDASPRLYRNDVCLFAA